MLNWKTLLVAAPVAASLLAATGARAESHGHFGGHGDFGHGGFSRHFDHHGGLIAGTALGLGALLGGLFVVQQQSYAPPVYVAPAYGPPGYVPPAYAAPGYVAPGF